MRSPVRDVSRRRWWGVGAATAVLSAMVVALPVVAAAEPAETPQPRDCAGPDAQLRGDNFRELCLSEGRVAAMDDSSAADLAVDEISHSDNVRHLANLPKQPPFDGTSSFGTDMAFTNGHAIVGNYNGFVIYDVSDPSEPTIVSQVVCPGAQNDVSVHGNLLVLSVDSSRNDDSCASTPQSATEKSSWEGIRIFDISDLSNPQYVKAVETNCGSHTHTLVPGGRDAFYVYVSSYFPSSTFPDCPEPHDAISIVKVPVNAPDQAAVVGMPNLFPDGGNDDSGSTWFPTSGCHDITAYPEKNIAAGACMGDGILLDITDRENPRVIHRVQDDVNFAFWHSATFNNTGTKVVYTDELGGGGSPTCNETVGPNQGANGIYDVTGSGDDRRLVFRSYFKIPRHQHNTENCVAHNGSLIPVPGKDYMVQAWYQGGVSIWEFTDSSNPEEIGYFERGPLSDQQLVLGGSWSAYWYNGRIFSSDIQKGLDVLQVVDTRLAKAQGWRDPVVNVQSQESYRG